MAEETTPKNATEEQAAAKPAKAKKEKPPAVEDKPFSEFMEQHFNPALKEALGKEGIEEIELNLVKEKLPIASSGSQECWQLKGNWDNGKRQFNLYFIDESIKGQKAFSYSTNGSKPSTIESFMIDERKITLDLMVMYTIQRLNGQKWLTRN